MRIGDTICLMLNYQLNGEPLVEGAYEEIELQINKQGSSKSMKKLLSNGDIKWDTVEYNGEEFTGYVVHLTQQETFDLGSYLQCQIRIKMDGEVGASGINDINLDEVLSEQVL